jgi:hypothetical protein
MVTEARVSCKGLVGNEGRGFMQFKSKSVLGTTCAMERGFAKVQLF